MRILFSTLATLFVSLIAFSAAAKTACTITINSKDEREVLKKRLPKGEWEIVELLPKEKKGTGDEDDEDASIPTWLNAACEKGIQCDVLLISGHFGGNFFGTSGFELSLEQLERAACRPECAGIIKKPKEVFLMGCNTLAGKEKDHRTPEEYLRVLLGDNMDRSRAEQTVALRYSPWGDANHGRMTAVFSESAKVYGFQSVGPLGRTSGPLLDRYLTSRAQNYSSYVDGLTKLSAPNADLLKIFGSTTITEAKGERSRSSSAICYLENKDVAHLSKVRFVESALLSAKPLEHAPAIASWLKTIQKREWSDEEGEVWDRLTWNKTLRDHFVSLAGNIQHLPSIEIGLWRFALHMRWISAVEYEAKLQAAVKPFFADKKITLVERDAICALLDEGERIKVDYRALGITNIDAHMAAALACLGNVDATIVGAAEKRLLSKTKEVREGALATIYLASQRYGYNDFNVANLRAARDSEKDEDMKTVLSMLIGRVGDLPESEWLAKAHRILKYSGAYDKNPDLVELAYAKRVPVSVLDVFAAPIASAKTREELVRSGSPTMNAVYGWAFCLKMDDMRAGLIAQAILRHQAGSMAAYLLVYVDVSEIDKAKKKEIYEAVLAGPITNQDLRENAVEYLKNLTP